MRRVLEPHRASGSAWGADGVLFSTTFVDNVAEGRAMKAGYPEGYATEVRHRRAQDALHRP
jgi:hypothetical protein